MEFARLSSILVGTEACSSGPCLGCVAKVATAECTTDVVSQSLELLMHIPRELNS